jgi:hypothetical protein
VSVIFSSGDGFEATFAHRVEDGVYIEIGAKQPEDSSRVLFVPWSAIRHLELLEEAD